MIFFIWFFFYDFCILALRYKYIQSVADGDGRIGSDIAGDCSSGYGNNGNDKYNNNGNE